MHATFLTRGVIILNLCITHIDCVIIETCYGRAYHLPPVLNFDLRHADFPRISRQFQPAFEPLREDFPDPQARREAWIFPLSPWTSAQLKDSALSTRRPPFRVLACSVCQRLVIGPEVVAQANRV